jgi:hypothetical protein
MLIMVIIALKKNIITAGIIRKQLFGLTKVVFFLFVSPQHGFAFKEHGEKMGQYNLFKDIFLVLVLCLSKQTS